MNMRIYFDYLRRIFNSASQFLIISVLLLFLYPIFVLLPAKIITFISVPINSFLLVFIYLSSIFGNELDTNGVLKFHLTLPIPKIQYYRTLWFEIVITPTLIGVVVSLFFFIIFNLAAPSKLINGLSYFPFIFPFLMLSSGYFFFFLLSSASKMNFILFLFRSLIFGIFCLLCTSFIFSINKFNNDSITFLLYTGATCGMVILSYFLSSQFPDYFSIQRNNQSLTDIASQGVFKTLFSFIGLDRLSSNPFLSFSFSSFYSSLVLIFFIYIDDYNFEFTPDVPLASMAINGFLFIPYFLFISNLRSYLSSCCVIQRLPISKRAQLSSLLFLPLTFIFPIAFIAILWFKMPLYFFFLAMALTWLVIASYTEWLWISSLPIMIALSVVFNFWFNIHFSQPARYQYIIQHKLEYIVIIPMMLGSILWIRRLVYIGRTPILPKILTEFRM